MRTLVACLAATALVLLTPVPALAGFPGQNGKIAFESNRDGNSEIYTMNPDGSNVTRLTNNPGADRDPAWSRDGTKIAFTRGSGIPHIWVMDADGTNPTQVTNTSSWDSQPSWAPDGTRLVFTSNIASDVISQVDVDGTDRVDIVAGSSPAWSPDGEPIVFSQKMVQDEIYSLKTFNPEGPGQDTLTSNNYDADPDWSPDHQFIVFDRIDLGRRLFTLRHDIQNHPPAVPVPGTIPGDREAAWSPDGTRLAFTAVSGPNGERSIVTMNLDGTARAALTPPGFDADPAWQPVNSPAPVTGYPRPKGATPVEFPLVPTYTPCTSPNRQHGPPLAFPSCAPPNQRSLYATVGTADSNAQPTKSSGQVRLDAIVGDPATAADEADVKIDAHITDVRCRLADYRCSGPALSDYTAALRGVFDLQITDRLNGYAGNREGTLTPMQVAFTMPCTPTPDTTVGASCDLTTTMDSLVPGSVPERKRAIWQLDNLTVEDGADPEEPRTLFARPGLFVP